MKLANKSELIKKVPNFTFDVYSLIRHVSKNTYFFFENNYRFEITVILKEYLNENTLEVVLEKEIQSHDLYLNHSYLVSEEEKEMDEFGIKDCEILTLTDLEVIKKVYDKNFN